MNIAIILNLRKKRAIELAKHAVSFLQCRRHSVNLLKNEADALDMPDLGRPATSLIESDIVLVFGGDGTILRAVKELDYSGPPYLGINLGRLGFLSTIKPEELETVIFKLEKNDYSTSRRNIIYWQTDGREEGYALNDVVVSKCEDLRMIELDVNINSSQFFSYVADGLILASATGSTAYSLSAGGPLLSPQSESIVMTPVAPHSLFDRSIVFTETDTVAINARQSVNISVDGRKINDHFSGKIQIKISDRTVEFVELEKESFYKALRDKLRTNEPLQF